MSFDWSVCSLLIRAFSRSLAATWEIEFSFFSSATKMFQFAGFPPQRYVFTLRWLSSRQPSFLIRRPALQWICAPWRSFSQLVASFFGSQCQGIRPVLLFFWPLLKISKKFFRTAVLIRQDQAVREQRSVSFEKICLSYKERNLRGT